MLKNRPSDTARLVFAACVVTVAVTAAPETKALASQEPVASQENRDGSSMVEAKQWVELLADDDFTVREQAMQRLREMGTAARPAIFQGLGSDDSEVQWRCIRLWRELHELDFEERADRFRAATGDVDRYEFPSWTVFRSRFRDTPQVRDLYLVMLNEEPVVLAILEGDGGPLEASQAVKLFERLSIETKNRLRQQGGGNRDLTGTTATLLFLALVSGREESSEQGSTINQALELPAVRDRLVVCESLRQLAMDWRERWTDDRPAFERLMAAMRDEWSEDAKQAARELLTEEAPATERQYALLALAKWSDESDDRLIAAYLQDSTPLGSHLTRGVLVKSELRDVALAVIIYRTGQDPEDFGFEQLRRDDRLVFSVTSIGFVDPSQREIAFERWQRELETR